MSAILVTGFPGFLGSELLPRLLARTDDYALCIVQPKFLPLAEKRARQIESARPGLAGRIRLVEGDITQSIEHVEAGEIREVYHFAAVYDLATKRDPAFRVNVQGTRRILELAVRSPQLERFHHISTCYVSGRHQGFFREEDLECGQRFNNFYEETKYLAEVEVRKNIGRLPVTIYRPSVVVGDSRSGETQKFDGPYFIIQWLLRQPKLAILPVVGRPASYTFNVVPRDFVIDALEHLSGLKSSEGKTYAIADPSPLTVDETIQTLAEATDRRVVRVPMTKWMAKTALDYVPGVYRLMRIPPAAVDYFVHPTSYATTNAVSDLAGSGIRAPGLREYASRLVAFARAHPEIGSAAMV